MAELHSFVPMSDARGYILRLRSAAEPPAGLPLPESFRARCFARRPTWNKFAPKARFPRSIGSAYPLAIFVWDEPRTPSSSFWKKGPITS